jgi:geranylgeranyl transferase type-2 subunit beta
VVDFVSLIYSAALLEAAAGIDVFVAAAAGWRSAVDAALEKFRRDDGGYAKTADGHSSSTYYSFLVVLCRQLLGRPVREPERLAEFIRSRRREDGGFVEIGPMKRSGTNPTAAAIGLLKILDALDEATRADAVGFLLDMQTDEGGLRANTRIPIADVLSTFTGLLTLADLDAMDEVDVAAARRFVEQLDLPSGGFRAALWDPGHDVEYSFYGLGSMALLADRSFTDLRDGVGSSYDHRKPQPG